MNNTDISGETQYFMSPVYDGYEIVEHHANEPEGRGGLCFHVDEDGISDGDGFPVSYNEHYVRIDEKSYRHVMNLFRKAGETMCNLGDKAGKPLDRPLSSGDFIYDDGDFIHIHKITDNRSKLWVNKFSYHTLHIYELEVDDDLAVVDNDRDYDKDEKESNPLLITGEIYRQALNMATSVIMELNDYLQALMSNAKNNDGKQVV